MYRMFGKRPELRSRPFETEVAAVRALAERGLNAQSTAGQAIGYKEVLQALAGEISMDEARDLVKRRTRHYAKRQLSWLRRDGRARWLDSDTIDEDEAVRLVLEATNDSPQQKGL